MFEPDAGTVSIEIGKSFIKLAETRFVKGRRKVLRLIRHRISQDRDAAVSGEIKDLLKTLKISYPKVRLILSRYLVTARLLKLPSVDEKEIGKMAKMEALKYIPYADEDAVSGYRVVARSPEGYSDVMLAVTQAGTVTRLLAILQEAGCGAPEYIALSSEALFLWYLSVRDKAQPDRALIINIDTDHIDINIAEGEKLVFTRGVLYDEKDSLRDQNIVDQVRISVVTYQKESSKTIDRIVITGIPARVVELKDVVSKGFDVPVEVIDQMHNIPLAEHARLDTEGESFVELLGVSLRPEEVRINLIPEAVREDIRTRTLKKSFSTTFILGVLIVSVILGLSVKGLYDKTVYLNRVNSEIKKLSPQVTKAKKMLKDIELINSQIAKRPLAIEVLGEVHKATPPDISLSVLDYESEGTVSIRGNASALNEIFKYVNALEASPCLENVKVRYANKRILTTNESVDFEINCLISKMK